MASLDSATLKLHRAHHHYVVLRDEEIAVRSGYTLIYPLTAKSYRNGLEYRFYVGEIPSIDEERWSTRIGDCLFNLRAALDHVVYALHVRHYRGKVPADAERAPQFPVLDIDGLRKRRGTRVSPKTERWPEIKRLARPQRAEIQRLQPYITRDDNLRFLRQAIRDIHDLNIVDKHRYLHVVSTATEALPVPTFPPEYGFRTSPTWGPLKSGTEVDRWLFDATPPNVAKQVDVHREVYAEISIDEAGQFTAVLPLLQALVTNAGRVVERFAKWFPPGSVQNVPIAESMFDAVARMRGHTR